MTQKDPWFKDGLRFSCTECGKCCTGSPGYVWITEAEIDELARSLSMPVEKVYQDYIRYKDGRYALREVQRGENYDCCFLKGKACSIYNARPSQCKTYPWWPQNLEDQDAWKRTQEECEGIHDEARLYTLGEIRERL